MPVSAAQVSGTIQKLIEDLGDDPDQVIPLPNVDGSTMSIILQYCDLYTSHVYYGTQDAVTEFLTPLPIDTIFSMLHAANYLDMQMLLQSLTSHVASMMRGKTPQELRDIFQITNDFTPEEEAEILEENAWAFASK
jgi:S-phase kinase-associated protein 1